MIVKAFRAVHALTNREELSEIMATPVLPTVVQQALDLPAGRLAAVIGGWPEPAMLASGPGLRRGRPLDDPGGLSPPRLRGHRPAMVDPPRRRLVRDRAGRPARRAGRLRRRFGLAEAGGCRATPEALPVPGGADRLPRLRPGPAARAAAPQGRPRLAAARPADGPVRHGRHRRSPDGQGRPCTPGT